MKYRLDNCYYELVKDLLMSQDSMIENVAQIKNGAIITLKQGVSVQALYSFLNQEPLHTFCAHSYVSKI